MSSQAIAMGSQAIPPYVTPVYGTSGARAALAVAARVTDELSGSVYGCYYSSTPASTPRALKQYRLTLYLFMGATGRQELVLRWPSPLP